MLSKQPSRLLLGLVCFDRNDPGSHYIFDFHVVCSPPLSVWNNPRDEVLYETAQLLTNHDVCESEMPTTSTSRVRGPCTPSTRFNSMSEVADGPEMNVMGRLC